jgi:hypothetical protein
MEERLTPSGVQTAGSYTALVKTIAADTAPHTDYVTDITKSFTFNAGGQVTISKLDPTSTLTIEGQNGNNFTLTGNGNRLFDVVGKSQNVTWKDLTLTGGGGVGVSRGGAIKDQGGAVALSGVRVTNNSVLSPATPHGDCANGGRGRRVCIRLRKSDSHEHDDCEQQSERIGRNWRWKICRIWRRRRPVRLRT